MIFYVHQFSLLGGEVGRGKIFSLYICQPSNVMPLSDENPNLFLHLVAI